MGYICSVLEEVFYYLVVLLLFVYLESKTKQASLPYSMISTRKENKV